MAYRFPVLSAGSRVRRRCGFGDAHDGFHVSGVIKENAIAFAHGSKMFLCDRITHAGPSGAAIAQEVVKAIVCRFFFDQPVHAVFVV